MPKPLRIVIAVIVVTGIAGVLWHFATRDGNEALALQLSGNIEVTDARLAFQVPGRVRERLVDEGEEVTAGQLIAVLDDADQALGVARAEANVALAEAVLRELEAGSRPEDISRSRAQVDQARAQYALLENGSRGQEIAEAQAGVDQARAAAASAEAALELARSDERRSAELFGYGVIPESQHDAAATALESAERRLDQAKAAVASAEERLSLVREGPRTEQLDSARAALNQAQAAYQLVAAGPRAETIEQTEAQLAIAREALNQANQALTYTRLTAPFAGTVLSKSVEPGEYVTPGSGVVTIAALDEVWLRAYISETDLSRISLGQSVTVSADTYPGLTYPGRISYISDQAEFTPKAVQTHRERVKLVYLVKIAIENPDHELKPGMPADAVIALGE